MSDWYWKVIVLKAAFMLTCFASYLRADDNVQQLPFCNPSNLKDGPGNDDLMIVSTLDGKLTALSTQNGMKAWDIETQPLLSSNLHKLELTSGGKWVRLVPSLRGTLYSLSEDSIEPLPFDAEQLLSSSYKYTDDLVIAGARETVWVGIDANTGAVMYECGSRGCNSEQAARGGARRVLVLRRHSHTVRALDPRQGSEKWNFSVAEHQLALSPGECGGGAGPAAPVTVAVALHDGRVALRSQLDYSLIWQHKLEAPVAGMWRLQGGALRSIDVVWEATQTIVSGVSQQPSLYIGVHNTQLYIQESPFYTRKLETAVSVSPVPWKLLTGRPMIDSDTAVSLPDSDNALAQVAQYGSKGLIGDYGVFLYLQEMCDQSVQATEEDIDAATVERDNASDDHDHHHIHVHVYSLWFWWKEVLLIAVSSALLMNLMIWPRFFAPKLAPSPENKTRQLTRTDLVTHYDRFPTQFQPTHHIAITHIPPPAPDRSPPVPEYSGRYETDFTPLRCLGRGGFGVVFEVRNNIDHCCYALKRITLPQKENKRERVRREVRALAKLDHINIVRYFNAWEERPPPPHMQLRDQALIRELDSQSALSEEYSSTPLSSPAKSPNAKGDSVILNLHKPFDTELLDYKLQEPSKRNRPNVHQAGHRRRPPDGKRSLPAVLDDVTVDVADKHIPSLSCSDSIVFDSEAPVGDRSTRSTRSPQDVSRAENRTNDRLSKVQECDYKTDSTTPKKKKGHTRHWSLDACVKGFPEEEALAPLFLYIQMQLCRRDSLHDWLRANRTHRDLAEIKSLFRQIVCAVDYVHAAGLIHRDLKPSNILFSQDGVVKVGDFGLVTSMGDTSQDGERPEVMDAYQRHTYRVGTHLYMSPEQAQCRPYSYKVDIYSLGLILFELLQPFGTESERVRCLEDVKQGRYPHGFREKYPDEVVALELMLSADPGRRPTALGVRARAPLYEPTDERHHFTLPPQALTVSA